MFLTFRRKIEAKRGSKKWFWYLLVLMKDVVWYILFLFDRCTYLPKMYVYSSLRKKRDGSKFVDVKTYCMFIGYSRSGHSIIGSILDAHPNIIISHELGAIDFFNYGFSIDQIFSLILKKSKEFTEALRVWEGYSYLVPNQWHSRFSKLLVIGDKKGDATSRKLKNNMKFFYKFQNKLKKKKNIDIKIIHVYRNPYDNIATIFKKRKKTMNDAIEYYFNMVDFVIDAKKYLPANQILDIKQEDFIEDPKTIINKICNFLGVETTDDYLDDAVSIVWPKPHQSRFGVAWTKDLIEEVDRRKAAAPYLTDYFYEK